MSLRRYEIKYLERLVGSDYKAFTILGSHLRLLRSHTSKMSSKIVQKAAINWMNSSISITSLVSTRRLATPCTGLPARRFSLASWRAENNPYSFDKFRGYSTN